MNYKIEPNKPEPDEYKNIKCVLIGEDGETAWQEKLWLTDEFCLIAREDGDTISIEAIESDFVLDYF